MGLYPTLLLFSFFLTFIQSLPTINFATTWSLSGSQAIAGPLVKQTLEWCVATVNQRGGIMVAGQQYLINLYGINDDSSSGYVKLLFDSFGRNNSIHYLFPPWSSPLTAWAIEGQYNTWEGLKNITIPVY